MDTNKFIEEKVKEIFVNTINTVPDKFGETITGVTTDYSQAVEKAKQALSDAIKYGEEIGKKHG